LGPISRQIEPDFQDLSARTFRLCLALLRHESDAAEAAQEALMRSWAARGRKRPDASWWTWIGGFAVRVCRESRRRPFPVAPSGDEPTTGHGDAGWTAGRSELARRIHEAVAELPDRQREVITLRWIVGFSTQEAADMLGCPVGTIKSNLHRAVTRLREVLPADAGLERESR